MDTAIASTIRDQLGGARFAVMTGARHFRTAGRDLTFDIPGRTVKVELTPADLYRVTVFTKRGRVDGTEDGIFADDLQECFTRLTGLYTTL